MRILNAVGHVEVTWEASDPEATAHARREFVRLRDLGYVPFDRPRETTEFHRATQFDQEAAEVFWLRPLRGG